MPNNQNHPHGTEIAPHLRIPAAGSSFIEMRFADLPHRDCFNPQSWNSIKLDPAAGQPGWFEIDLNTLGLNA